MKTLSFHDLQVGRGARALLELDTPTDSICLSSGLQLIVAPNGYGKTTLLQTIAGVLKPMKGEIRLEGKRLNVESDVVYVSEYLNFPKFVYPLEWVEFMARGKPGSDLQRWIDGFSLGHKMSSFMGRMSQGERRKVTWLGAHASNRPVILLDEPLDGLDLLAIRAAREMLDHWRSQGRIVFIVAHQVSEVLDLADRVFLVRERKLRDWSDLAETRASSIPPEEFRAKVLEYYLAQEPQRGKE